MVRKKQSYDEFEKNYLISIYEKLRRDKRYISLWRLWLSLFKELYVDNKTFANDTERKRKQILYDKVIPLFKAKFGLICPFDPFNPNWGLHFDRHNVVDPVIVIQSDNHFSRIKKLTEHISVAFNPRFPKQILLQKLSKIIDKHQKDISEDKIITLPRNIKSLLRDLEIYDDIVSRGIRPVNVAKHRKIRLSNISKCFERAYQYIHGKKKPRKEEKKIIAVDKKANLTREEEINKIVDEADDFDKKILAARQYHRVIELNPNRDYKKVDVQNDLDFSTRNLSRRQKEVYEMKYNCGLSVKEIAARLGINRSRVYQLLNDGKSKIKSSIHP